MFCRNTTETDRHERDQVDRDRAHELAMADSWRALFAGDYDDHLADMAADAPLDWVHLALLLLYPRQATPNRCAYRDLYVTVERLVLEKALEAQGLT